MQRQKAHECAAARKWTADRWQSFWRLTNDLSGDIHHQFEGTAVQTQLTLYTQSCISFSVVACSLFIYINMCSICHWLWISLKVNLPFHTVDFMWLLNGVCECLLTKTVRVGHDVGACSETWSKYVEAEASYFTLKYTVHLIYLNFSCTEFLHSFTHK